ncbi:MAG: IS1 family transposase [Methylococcaceae bacterium]
MKPEWEDTLFPAACYDVVEGDALWSVVKGRANQRWLGIARCRTRQGIAYVIGDRSEKSCQTLWAAIPERYKQTPGYSDLWGAYQKVFPTETHRSVGNRGKPILSNDGTTRFASG